MKDFHRSTKKYFRAMCTCAYIAEGIFYLLASALRIRNHLALVSRSQTLSAKSAFAERVWLRETNLAPSPSLLCTDSPLFSGYPTLTYRYSAYKCTHSFTSLCGELYVPHNIPAHLIHPKSSSTSPCCTENHEFRMQSRHVT